MLTTAAKLNLKSLNWKNLEEISESLKQKKGEVLNFSSVVIKKELDKDIHTLATVLEDAKSNAGEDTIGKVTGALGELKVLSCAFDTSEHKEKHGVFTNEAMKTLQLVVEHLQGNRPLIDDFLNKTQDSKVVQKVVSESSNTSEVHQEEDDATDSQVDMVEEEQSNDGNTQDSKTKKGKGKKKAKNSNVDSMVDSVVEKQSTSGNNQDPKNKKGKGNNKGKNKGKKGKGKNK